MILIVAVMLVPLALGFSYAFRDVKLLNPLSGGFIGLDHFRELIDDKTFARALKNTFFWAGASVALQFTFGLILALLLNRPFWGRGIVQALVFLPWAVPSFLSGLNWAWMFNPVIGPIPHWLFALGLMDAPDNILSDPHNAMWGPIIANVWWGIPFFAITLLAALQAMPPAIAFGSIAVPLSTLRLAKAQFEALARAFEKSGNIVSQVMCEASASSLDRAILDAGACDDADDRSQHAA